jgi:hypothetical protein
MSQNEQIAMLLITGITNFACFPALYVVYNKRMYFQFYVGLFTFITSFMYHSLESVEWEYLYLDRGTWDKLDNIGSITCFQMLFVYWMDNLHWSKGRYYSTHTPGIDLQIGMISLFFTMIVQANHPWKLENTFIPILLFVLLFLVAVALGRRPRFNSYYLKRGMACLGVAICCFVKGLDEFSDYLRIYHGLWHCFIGFGSFFLWQSIDKDRSDARMVYKYSKQPRFAFWDVLGKVVTFRFNSGENADSHKRL